MEQLRQWRESNERKSEEIIEIWEKSLCNNIDKLANDKHLILEQVIYAALDCHMYRVATVCLLMLSNDFPGSLRVMKLKATLLEAKEKYDEALAVLDTIIKTDETNTGARKRRVAILKAQGLIPEAIKELVDYLKKFMSDVEGWQELCSLYLQVQDYSRAVYCAEELLIHQPHNHLHHQRLAEIRYTMGGLENMELAKTYYCHALKLNPENTRALLGLFLVTNNLLSQYKSSGNSAKRKETFRLCQWAQARTAQRTAKESAAPPLDQMMLNLAITD
ncbi:ER membrane protein complex subunit 2-A isoform X2 [Manduca sexta]|uniref:ER membrane protein complex subunit 2 n=2 Tax=Manduca sexta TaxID=7130 RepID=A0A921ZQW8_MANSE|nr:ER membrane protein complex subunit 2-A isoform X2 [Manduca sexta]XP_030035777.1 ER membrane protein complex subunit 2-A isoform X2 [Manduca sexta]KAG6462316.1 hypothetical protein O3G_MSEX013178 [Manduca sexta]